MSKYKYVAYWETYLEYNTSILPANTPVTEIVDKIRELRKPKFTYDDLQGTYDRFVKSNESNTKVYLKRWF